MHHAPPARRSRALGRSRLTILSLLLISAVVLPIVPVRAQDEEIPRAGAPLNSGGFFNHSRQFLSNGALLALDQAIAYRLADPDPFYVSVAGANANTGGGGSAQQVPFRNPAPAFSRNLLISRNFGYSPFQTEPHIAVNPLDPDHIVAALIDYNMGSTM
ncbi:MAG: hypothetical protein AB7V46_11500 [Thermomicrobiales bacterium]